MKATVSLDEFRKGLSDIVAKVMYGQETFLVKKHNKPGVIVISEEEYEKLRDPKKRFSSQEKWDEFFVFTDKIASRISDKDKDKFVKVVSDEVKAVRAESLRNRLHK